MQVKDTQLQSIVWLFWVSTCFLGNNSFNFFGPQFPIFGHILLHYQMIINFVHCSNLESWIKSTSYLNSLGVWSQFWYERSIKLWLTTHQPSPLRWYGSTWSTFVNFHHTKLNRVHVSFTMSVSLKGFGHLQMQGTFHSSNIWQCLPCWDF
jgi:hypothetical protein